MFKKLCILSAKALPLMKNSPSLSRHEIGGTSQIDWLACLLLLRLIITYRSQTTVDMCQCVHTLRYCRNCQNGEHLQSMTSNNLVNVPKKSDSLSLKRNTFLLIKRSCFIDTFAITIVRSKYAPWWSPYIPFWWFGNPVKIADRLKIPID